MRRGFALVEVLVVLIVGALLGHLVMRAAASARSRVEHIARAGSTLEGARLARVLVGRAARAGPVRPAPRPDEVEIVLPIGWAVRCDSVWSWAGIRAPDPGRDRVEAIDGQGRRHGVALTASRPAPCGRAEAVGRTFVTTPDVPGAVVLRIVEPGVVRVDDAVRYARAATSRQPISAAVLDAGLSHVRMREERVEVVVADERLRFERRW